MASELAYYSLMAVTPALVAGFLLFGELGRQGLAERIVANTADVLAPDGERFIRESMAQMSARSGVSGIAVALSLWGARRRYRGLDQGVRKIDGHSVWDAARVLVLGGLGTAGILGVPVAASLYADGELLRLLAAPFTFVIVLAVTYPILNGMAPELGRVENFPGSLFTAATRAWSGWSLVGRFAGVRSTACSAGCC